MYSEVGKGTRFAVDLPALIVAPPVPREDRPAELPPGAGELILVVDDEASVRAVAQVGGAAPCNVRVTTALRTGSPPAASATTPATIPVPRSCAIARGQSRRIALARRIVD